MGVVNVWQSPSEEEWWNQRNFNRRVWIEHFYVTSVNLEQRTITLTGDGFENPQTTLIHPNMPNWILMPGAEFSAIIPRDCLRSGSLLTVEWGGFCRSHIFEGLDEDEVWDIFQSHFEE